MAKRANLGRAGSQIRTNSRHSERWGWRWRWRWLDLALLLRALCQREKKRQGRRRMIGRPAPGPNAKLCRAAHLSERSTPAKPCPGTANPSNWPKSEAKQTPRSWRRSPEPRATQTSLTSEGRVAEGAPSEEMVDTIWMFHSLSGLLCLVPCAPYLSPHLGKKVGASFALPVARPMRHGKM